MAGEYMGGTTSDSFSAENSLLKDIHIEIEGPDALSVATALDLGKLATKRTQRKSFGRRESQILDDSLINLRVVSSNG